MMRLQPQHAVRRLRRPHLQGRDPANIYILGRILKENNLSKQSWSRNLSNVPNVQNSELFSCKILVAV
jgi:hypothetical protein